MKNTTPQTILFDLDGTLIDSAPDLAEAANRMRLRRQLPALDWSAYRAHSSMGARGMLAIAFDKTPQDADYEAWRTEYLDEYSQGLLTHTKAFEGVPALLEALDRAGIRWGIVTNKFSRYAEPIVAAFDWAKTSGVLVCGDTTEHAKPHPAPMFHAANIMGVDPQHCWYVGDDLRDIQAGKAAGMQTVVAQYGYLGAGEDPQHWGAEYSIQTPQDLTKLLKIA